MGGETVRMGSLSLIQGLAEHYAIIGFDDLPSTVQHEAKRALLNFLGTAISGASDPALDIFVASLTSAATPSEGTIVGKSLRVDRHSAAFLNAVSANIADFDDTHIPTIIHPTAPVAPAVFAVSERRKLTGRQWIAAFAVGVDMECRMGLALTSDHYQRGWHITATCGVLGAAAAAAHALGASDTSMAHALACGATQSSGVVEALGTGSKSIGIGNACRNGLWSAELAMLGLTGSTTALEGPQGLFAVMGTKISPHLLMDGIGERWELANNTYKPYPCGVVINPVIDACLDLRRKALVGSVIAADTITEVTVTGNPLLLKRANRPELRQQRDAQISLQHAVAIALLYGTPEPSHFAHPFTNNKRIECLRKRIFATENASLEVDQAEVAILFDNGRSFYSKTERASGSLENPLSDNELMRKFHQLVDARVGSEAAEALASKVWTLDQVEDVSSLLAATRPSPPVE